MPLQAAIPHFSISHTSLVHIPSPPFTTIPTALPAHRQYGASPGETFCAQQSTAESSSRAAGPGLDANRRVGDAPCVSLWAWENCREPGMLERVLLCLLPCWLAQASCRAASCPVLSPSWVRLGCARSLPLAISFSLCLAFCFAGPPDSWLQHLNKTRYWPQGRENNRHLASCSHHANLRANTFVYTSAAPHIFFEFLCI